MSRPIRSSLRTPGVLTYQVGNVRTLNDAVGNAGVDLREEVDYLYQQTQQGGGKRALNDAGVDLSEETDYLYQQTLRHGSTYGQEVDRTREQAPKVALDTAHIFTQMNIHASKHNVIVSHEAVLYFCLALRARIHRLVANMAEAAHHRTETQHRPSFVEGTPLWKIAVRSDVGKQLDALERVGRAEDMECRQKLATRKAMEMQAQALIGQPVPLNDLLKDPESLLSFTRKRGTKASKPPKMPKTPKTPKEKGLVVTARNWSQETKMKMANETANEAVGLTKRYSWLSSAGSTPAGSAKRTKLNRTMSSVPLTPAPAKFVTRGSATPHTPAKVDEDDSETMSLRSDTLSETETLADEKEEESALKLTMRDALFVIAKERGHGGGRGAGYGYV